jgi:hypothetical protein
MSAQTPEVRAYVFVKRYAKFHVLVGAIATSVAEAENQLRERHADSLAEVTFFGCASAIMQPAMIEWWEGSKRIEKLGRYTFLEGMFFCQCDDYEEIAGCRKEKTLKGWTAVIYRHNYYIKPL